MDRVELDLVHAVDTPGGDHGSHDLRDDVEGHLAGGETLEEPESDGCEVGESARRSSFGVHVDQLTVAGREVTSRGSGCDNDSDCREMWSEEGI